MSTIHTLTGKPSIDRPWMKYYPDAVADLKIPYCSVYEYMKNTCKDPEITAIHYYGADISWKTIFDETEAAARSLRALGFGEGDQIPCFFQSMPEFVSLLFAIDRIGASIICRDNTLEENVEAVFNSGSTLIFAQDYLSQEELETYLAETKTEKVVTISPYRNTKAEEIPDYVRANIESRYHKKPASGNMIMTWDDFLKIGSTYTGPVDAPVDPKRILFRVYTSGSTGPSKQVIHSGENMISIIHQMFLWNVELPFRVTWMTPSLPPALIAVTICMILAPMALNRLLILNPFADINDFDLEVMRYRPNMIAMIPMMMEILMRGRIPEDYDLSFLFTGGVGAESFNNCQLSRAEKFLAAHNCKAPVTVGYGLTEAGSTVTLPSPAAFPVRNGCVGMPLPLATVSIFKPGTQEELTYNQLGEVCKTGPGTMLGYDNRPGATEMSLQTHEDGKLWLHTGDIGYMDENGTLYVLTRGDAQRYGGGQLATLPMENILANAEIAGIDDEFFVIYPDPEHEGFFLPYLYIVLLDGYSLNDVKDAICACLESHMQPVEITVLPKRPFYHFKTNRRGMASEISKKLCH